MNHDFMKRGYLLPEGCKDLIDALNQLKYSPQQHSAPLIDPSKLNHLIDFMKLKPHLSKFMPTLPLWKPSV